MRKTILASVAALSAGAGLAFGQAPPVVASTDAAAVSAVGEPMKDPKVVPVMGREPLYLQGGPPYGVSPPGGCFSQMNPCHQWHQNHQPHFGYAGQYSGGGCAGGDCGGGDCGAGGCGGGGYGGGCGGQVHKAAGGPDCLYFDVAATYYLLQPMAFSAPILSTAPIAPIGAPASTGRLTDEGARIIFGDNDLRYGPVPGLRLNGGFWCEDRIWGLAGTAWLTEQRAEVDDFFAPATGRVVLARPNFNVLTNVPDSIVVALPPDFGGSASVYTNIRVGGADVNLMRNFAYYDKFKMTGLAGFRWMSLNEQLRVDTQSVIPTADPGDPAFRDINDTITTRNNFYGGQLGLDTEFRRGRWFTNVTGKAAAGFVHEKLNMSGFTRFTDSGVVREIPFGALVLEPNSGDFSKREFAYVTEANVKLGYQWTQRLSFYLGYDFMYMSKVVRPGDQLSPNVNPSLLPIADQFNPQRPFGAPEPALRFATNDFWLHGIQAGAMLRY